jgi:glycosyltransferase involved in cell wall biosynthesis
MLPESANLPSSEGGALVIDWRVPVHDWNAGALRLFRIIQILRQLGVPVVVLPHDLQARQPYTSELEEMGVQVVHGGVDVRRYIRENASKFDFCYINYADLAQSYVPFLRKVAPGLRIVYDTVDLHFLRETRRASYDGSMRRAATYHEVEVQLAQMSNAVIVVTERERDLFSREVPDVPMYVIPTIHVARTPQTPFANREGLLFVGSFPYAANGDAVCFFVEEILPRIRRQLGEISFFIVGSDPPADVRKLASESIQVTGWVQDLAPYYERCRVFVAPLRWGAGIKGKIGESMAHGLPAVVTTVGAEGMNLVDGSQVMIADDPEEFANKVVEAYTTEQVWHRLSASGLEHVARHYSPEVVREKVTGMLEKEGLLSPAADRRSPDSFGSDP